MYILDSTTLTQAKPNPNDTTHMKEGINKKETKHLLKSRNPHMSNTYKLRKTKRIPLEINPEDPILLKLISLVKMPFFHLPQKTTLSIKFVHGPDLAILQVSNNTFPSETCSFTKCS